MPLTQIRITQYLEMEKQLKESKMSLHIRQIADPENIKKLLCENLERTQCYIRFTDSILKLCSECNVKNDYRI